MSIYEYDQQKHIRQEREDAYAEGQRDGYDIGQKDGIEKIISDMLRLGKTPEQITDFCGYALEEVLRIREKILQK